MIKRCRLRGAKQTTARESDDVGLWPIADVLAAGSDVGFLGVKRTCRLGGVCLKLTELERTFNCPLLGFAAGHGDLIASSVVLFSR